MNLSANLKIIAEEYKLLAKTSPRELWIIYFSKLMESIGFFSMILVMVLFLSSDLGMSDIQAGKTFGLWSTTYGILVFFAGTLCDVIGIKRSLLFGFLFLMAGRLCLALSTNSMFITGVALPLVAIGTPLMIPIKSAAIKKYTTKRSRALAFSVFYSIMNIGVVISGICVDIVGNLVKKMGGIQQGEKIIRDGHDASKYVLHFFGSVNLSGYQLIFLLGFITSLIGFFTVLFFVRKDVYAEENIEAEIANSKKIHSVFSEYLEKIYFSVSKSIFWRFMLLLIFMLFVRILMTHTEITIPKFMLREIGIGSAIGMVYAINGFIIMLLPPVISVFLTRIKIINAMIIGTFISASSALFLAVNPAVYNGMAKFISSIISYDFHPLYVPLVLFNVFYSIGEAIWSPKLYEYTANIAPKGEESTYMAMNSLPWYLAKAPAGVLSGYLLMTYCPQDGVRNSSFMWLLIAVMSLASPVLVMAFRKLITGGNKEAA